MDDGIGDTFVSVRNIRDAKVVIFSEPVLNPASMHSIVYVVISLGRVWRGTDCSKMTAWILLPAPRVKGQNLLAANGVSYFSGIRRGRKRFWSAAVSTNPNCCDTSVILSQLETSRPRGSERVAFIAFGNFRSFTRYGCLVLGELDHFTSPVAGHRLRFSRK